MNIPYFKMSHERQQICNTSDFVFSFDSWNQYVHKCWFYESKEQVCLSLLQISSRFRDIKSVGTIQNITQTIVFLKHESREWFLYSSGVINKIRYWLILNLGKRFSFLILKNEYFEKRVGARQKKEYRIIKFEYNNYSNVSFS